VLSRQTESVKALIHGGADINAQRDDGMSPLSVASSEGFTDIVRIHLDNGADTETTDNFGRTPALLSAALNGHYDADRGANVNTADRNTDTALMAASSRGRFTVVSLLLDNGADINSRGKNNVASLYCAAAQGLRESRS